MVLPEYPTYNGFARTYAWTYAPYCTSLAVNGYRYEAAYARCRPYYTRSCYRTYSLPSWRYSSLWYDTWPYTWWPGDLDSTVNVYNYYPEGAGVAADSDAALLRPAPVVAGAPVVMGSGLPATPGAEGEIGVVLGEPETPLDECFVEFLAGRYADARRCFVRLVMEGDTDGLATFYYGLASFALGEFDVAGAGMRRAIVVNPALLDDPPAVAQLYLDVERLNRQLGLLAVTVEQSQGPANHDALFALGYLCYALGLQEDAAAAVGRLGAIAPDDIVAQHLRERVGGEESPAGGP